MWSFSDGEDRATIKRLLTGFSEENADEVSKALRTPNITQILHAGLVRGAYNIVLHLPYFLELNNPAITKVFDRYFAKHLAMAKHCFNYFLCSEELVSLIYLEGILKAERHGLQNIIKQHLSSIKDFASLDHDLIRHLLHRKYFSFQELNQWIQFSLRSDHPIVKAIAKTADEQKIAETPYHDATVIFLALATALTEWSNAFITEDFLAFCFEKFNFQVNLASPILAAPLRNFLILQRQALLNALPSLPNPIPTPIIGIMLDYLGEAAAFQSILDLIDTQSLKAGTKRKDQNAIAEPVKVPQSVKDYCEYKDLIVRSASSSSSGELCVSMVNNSDSAELAKEEKPTYVPFKWTDEQILQHSSQVLKREYSIDVNTAVLLPATAYSPQLFSQTNENTSAPPKNLDAFIYQDIFAFINNGSKTIYCFSHIKDHPMILDWLKQRIQSLHCKDYKLLWLQTMGQDIQSKSYYTVLNFVGMALYCAGHPDCHLSPFRIPDIELGERELDSLDITHLAKESSATVMKYQLYQANNSPRVCP